MRNESGYRINVSKMISIWLLLLKLVPQSLWLYNYALKGQILCRKFGFKAQSSLRDSDHSFGFSLSDRCLLSLEQVPIHIFPTGALVPEDCQVGNENSTAWEDMSFSPRMMKSHFHPFPRADVLFSCHFFPSTLVTHCLILSDSSNKPFPSIMWQFILSKLVSSPSHF